MWPPPANTLSDATPPSYDELDEGLADAIRSVINQHQLASDELPKSIAVVSALHGEGVTTVSRALALLIAHENNASVCLLDCSWMADAAPDADRLPLGIFELMTDQCSVGEALQATAGEPNMMTLAPGNVPASRRHVLARSAQFESLMKLLNDQFDHLVFDTPPILGGAAGLAVLRHADAHLLVVRHGVTTIPQVRAVNDKLETVQQLGVVLNRYRTSVPARFRRLLST
jgi:Mrp family chromosome partitioning ATPase